MRIAVSGAHRTGKTTLVEELSLALPSYAIVEEPYRQLEEEGYEFPEMPSVEDFEAQLSRSIESIDNIVADVLLDRCPVDIVAYLMTHRDADAFEPARWMPLVQRAMKTLDVVIFVPVDEREHDVLALDDRVLRRGVDEQLRELLEAEEWSSGVEVLEVAGGLPDRVRQVLDRVRRSAGAASASGL